MRTPLKLVIVGESAVGKSALLRRFSGEPWKEQHHATVGIDFVIRTMGNVKFHCWDTAGQERFRSNTISMFKNAHIVLFAYDLSNAAETLQHLLSYYLINRDVPPDCYRVLVGTKLDLPPEAPGKSLELLRECNRHVHASYVTSAKTGDNVAQLFEHLCKAYADGLIKLPEKPGTPLVTLGRQSPEKRSCC